MRQKEIFKWQGMRNEVVIFACNTIFLLSVQSTIDHKRHVTTVMFSFCLQISPLNSWWAICISQKWIYIRWYLCNYSKLFWSDHSPATQRIECLAALERYESEWAATGYFHSKFDCLSVETFLPYMSPQTLSSGWNPNWTNSRKKTHMIRHKMVCWIVQISYFLLPSNEHRCLTLQNRRCQSVWHIAYGNIDLVNSVLAFPPEK